MAAPIPSTLDTGSSPKEAFASQYDLDNPLEAMTSYSRLMHQHTKRQMDIATRASNRRSNTNEGVSSMTQLASETSTGSVDSVEE